MIFRQVREIMEGTKTETRRLVKTNEVLVDDTVYTEHTRCMDCKPERRIKWQVGRDYAVIPKRGQPGLWWRPDLLTTWTPSKTVRKIDMETRGYMPLRYRITHIHSERLQSITAFEALAEGVLPYKGRNAPRPGYYDVLPGAPEEAQEAEIVAGYRRLWMSINNRPGDRWSDNPLVWVIRFEVVKPT